MKRFGTRVIAKHVDGYLVSSSMEARLKRSETRGSRKDTARRLAQGVLLGLREPVTDAEQREYAFTMSRRIWLERQTYATRYHFDHDTKDLTNTAQETIIAERARKMAQLAAGYGVSDIA